ncbi:hypothetical protein [Rhodoplanes sp. SY1]|uniref:hypothetical protein n=1 Tax=Rhodoplanes sp. SY1 TaxID=3166646 RepID=UPI0038B47E1F
MSRPRRNGAVRPVAPDLMDGCGSGRSAADEAADQNPPMRAAVETFFGRFVRDWNRGAPAAVSHLSRGVLMLGGLTADQLAANRPALSALRKVFDQAVRTADARIGDKIDARRAATAQADAAVNRVESGAPDDAIAEAAPGRRGDRP